MKDNDAFLWAEKIRKCRIVAENSDEWGVRRFLRLFEGMSSLNDLILHRNSMMLVKENDELEALLRKTYRAAKDLVTDRH